MQKQTLLLKNEEFRKFVADVAKHIAVKNPATVEELLEKALVEETKTVKEYSNR